MATPDSQFQFLSAEWPMLFEPAAKAESLVNSDARSSCFHARRALELAVHWLYKHDAALKLPYQDHLSALIHAPSFRNAVGPAIFAKIKLVKDLGNLAVHSHKPVRQLDALTAAKELFHIMFWLARTYARGAKPADGLCFNPDLLPKSSSVPAQTLEQLQKLESQLRERDEKLSQLLSGKKALDDELQRLRIEVAETKQQNSARADDHDYSEAETRDYFIDLLLKEAGWALADPQDREFPVTGMPNNTGEGFVDYVLWGDDGKPLGLVEAKRTKRDSRVGQQQAKLYADCLEKQFGQRPVIFYSNGYDHWMWDGLSYPPRPVQGFYKKAELELLIQRREARKGLADARIDESIVERYYQSRAIRRVGEAFERDLDRKALLTMATGAGKTRTVIALCELLMRCNWVKRVLFLADRVALVRQAVNAFKRFLPDTSPVNLVTEKDAEGRVYVSTYPTMMGLIEEARDGQRRFGVGHFDLVIIDEAHRSVYQKYGAIFEYFDSLLVGLTATPKDEVDRNTYRLFNLESGVPTDNYTLDEAVRDGFLVPPKAVSVPLRFQREGISYDQLSEEEKEEWDALDWSEDGTIPNRVEAEAVNRWLFNKDTVDKVLEHLMTRGLKVAGGDRLGKTIVFAKNHDHAQFIAERFNINYPHYKGEFARVIDFEAEYVQNLIDNFSIATKDPHIAISVDMLDTGIDIPEVVNLVFFKLVRSKTKFWQMLGRGTRLCPDLFGPGKDKEFFYVFDYCQNLEFFSQQLPPTEGNTSESLAKRLFNARLELIGELDKKVSIEEGQDGGGLTGEAAEAYGSNLSYAELRRAAADLLRTEVAAMNVNNFVVRPKRRLVEKYAATDAWNQIDGVAYSELSHEVAGLPTELDAEDEEAKRFDLLILNLQLAVLRQEPSFARLRDQVKGIAGLLQDKASIPMIQAELPLILELLTDEWWQNVTVPMLETVRRRLRSLVKLIEKKERKPIYTDFEDMMGSEREFTLPGFSTPSDFERFRAKARQFLKANENHITVYKLRMNEPLTPTDLAELERMLSESGVGNAEDVQKAKEANEGLGLFVRSLIGLDREAAKKALAGFLLGKTWRANQIEFLNLIIDHLTEHGSIDTRLLYDSPYTDFSPRGVDGVFESKEVDELVSILEDVRKRAVG
ncbi:MAG: DEAD/DEAH box helicase family protein [Candidatus Binatia bacterium]|nr:DEAD/DEAH box helicase family protein [Candidatus Binatia bacterium]